MPRDLPRAAVVRPCVVDGTGMQAGRAAAAAGWSDRGRDAEHTHTHTPTRAHAHVTGGQGAARACARLACPDRPNHSPPARVLEVLLTRLAVRGRFVRARASIPPAPRSRRHTAMLTHTAHTQTHTHTRTHTHAHTHAHQSTAGRHVRAHTPPLGRPAAPRAGLACVLTDLPAGVWVRAEGPMSGGRRGRGAARAGRRSRRGKHGLLRGTRPLSARPRGASSAEAGLGFLC